MTREAAAAAIRAVQARPEVTAFHETWYHAAGMTWASTRWMGVPLQKSPLDLWIQQELIADLKPSLIIETGSFHGGSALFYAHCLDLVGAPGRVLSIDIAPLPSPVRHPRVTFLTADSTGPAALQAARDHFLNTPAGPVVVVLDSDHSREHVARELDLYWPYVTPGSYLIVEDTNVSGKPVWNEQFAKGGGPYPAVEAFLAGHPEFQADALCERYLLTMHPGGWLKRVR